MTIRRRNVLLSMLMLFGSIILILGLLPLRFIDKVGAQDNPAQEGGSNLFLPFIIAPRTTEGLLLSALPSSLPADVEQSTTLLGRAFDEDGKAVSGVDVTFATSKGRFLNGSSLTSATTNSEGIASVQLYAVPQLGGANVSALVDTYEAQEVVSFELAECRDTEDNDVPNQASRQPSSVCQGSLQDDPVGEDDYYWVILEPGQSIQVQLASMPPGSDYDLVLYGFNPLFPDEGLTFLEFSNQNGAINEAISYTHAGDESEFFFININMSQKSTQSLNTYRMTVELDPLEPPGESIDFPVVSSAGEAALNDDPPRPPKP